MYQTIIVGGLNTREIIYYQILTNITDISYIALLNPTAKLI